MKLASILSHYQVTSIWHFTDRSNYNSIQKHGLLCLEYIENRGVNVNCYGGNALSHNLDRRYGLDSYVHAAFIPKHPMLYAKKISGEIKNPIWLKIDARVLFNPSTLFCDQIANARNAALISADKLDKCINLDALYNNPYASKDTQKAQILIPKMISPNLIQGVYCA